MTSTKAPSLISVKKVSKSFITGDYKNNVIDNLSFEVSEGEFFSIFGPNGCGKSTLLNLIAGILEPDDGIIELRNDYSAIDIVFQNYDKSLMPWLTCLENIFFPLEVEPILTKTEKKGRALSTLHKLGINLPIDHYPYQLSGGQKQLTCIARAMIRGPKILLLDEPFASLDYQTRIDMQETLQRIWEITKVTTIFISHEIDEALFLSDRILLLTPRPAKLSNLYKVNLKRPRDFSKLSTRSIVQLKEKILTKFGSNK